MRWPDSRTARSVDFSGYRITATASRGSKLYHVRSNAQAIQASLFASATTTMFTRALPQHLGESQNHTQWAWNPGNVG
jgi:hypothetical protein